VGDGISSFGIVRVEGVDDDDDDGTRSVTIGGERRFFFVRFGGEDGLDKIFMVITGDAGRLFFDRRERLPSRRKSTSYSHKSLFLETNP
jgi:hypothetical protein